MSEAATKTAQEHGLKSVEVTLKVCSGRESAIRALAAGVVLQVTLQSAM